MKKYIIAEETLCAWEKDCDTLDTHIESPFHKHISSASRSLIDAVRLNPINDRNESCNTCDNEVDDCPVTRYIKANRGIRAPGSIPLMAAAVILSAEVGIGKFPCHSTNGA